VAAASKNKLVKSKLQGVLNQSV